MTGWHLPLPHYLSFWAGEQVVLLLLIESLIYTSFEANMKKKQNKDLVGKHVLCPTEIRAE